MKNRHFSIFPNDDNGDVLWRMYCDGDNLSTPREMDFQVVFEDKAQAELFCAYIESCGFGSDLSHYPNQPDGRVWDVQVRRVMVPTYAAICTFEETLQEEAASGGGVNDGWGSFQKS